MVKEGTELTEPLIHKSGSAAEKDSFKEDYQYIFVFPNHFSEDEAVIAPLNEKISISLCKEIFANTFKLSEEEGHSESLEMKLKQETSQHIPQRHAWISEMWRGFSKENQGEVEFRRFLNLIITCVLRVMQEDLKLDLKLFFSRDKDEIFCKIRASEHNFKVQADLMDYHLQLKRPESIPRSGYSLICPYGRFEKNKDEEKSGPVLQKKVIKDVESNYKKYGTDERQAKTGNGITMFKYKDKVRILLAMISSVIDIGELLDNDILINHFCIHNEEQLAFLRSNWGSFSMFWKPQPLQKVKNYFGEKIAMYFAWLGYYVAWLIAPAIIGLVTFIIQLIMDNLDDKDQKMNLAEISLLIFSLSLALGSTLLDQLWIRRQNQLSWMWGTTDIQEVEQQRPTYKGKYGTDPVTGRKKKISNKSIWEKIKRSISMSVVFICIGSAVVAVAAIMIYRDIYASYSWGPLSCAVINALQIRILNLIYRRVAKFFTEWENYEYDTQYNDALCIKLYLFQFVNSYASLIYLGFIKCYGDEDNSQCLDELSLQLEVIFVFNVICNFFELGAPYCSNAWRKRAEKRHLKAMHDSGHKGRKTMTSTEKQASLSEYETPLDDYMELIIDYGYVVMFSAAFPIVPLIALFVNIIEVRVDAYKLCYLMKRPYPTPANSIGEWESIVRTISVIGALTNTAIIIFTANIFDLTDFATKWGYFMVIEHVLLVFKFLISRQVPDIPNDVKKGLIWSNRISDEKIYGKSSDVDQQRVLRNLYFKNNPNAIRERSILDPEKIALTD
ncbi:unnamed protein product [Blepharisma stoltei]|uniref:Anoctamin transmembrane domain-containing protein n=1 Tax=Blepharisma stoltei TaxID=1481888 RepID=A0AAU9K0M9_9CILI|nr:unnamed protein product [Blepharisma stoltei]